MTVVGGVRHDGGMNESEQLREQAVSRARAFRAGIRAAPLAPAEAARAQEIRDFAPPPLRAALHPLTAESWFGPPPGALPFPACPAWRAEPSLPVHSRRHIPYPELQSISREQFRSRV
jgi:hypothetical protein